MGVPLRPPAASDTGLYYSSVPTYLVHILPGPGLPGYVAYLSEPFGER